MTGSRSIALSTLVVRDYDEAIGFFVGRLGFALVEDSPAAQTMPPHGAKRWVVVAPEAGGAALLLAEAATPEQVARIGDQTGGRVAFFLHTDDFWRDYRRFLAQGVEFVRGAPRCEPYGTVAVFRDVCGNLWDLIGPPRAGEEGEDG